jgi:hypothetical protein
MFRRDKPTRQVRSGFCLSVLLFSVNDCKNLIQPVNGKIRQVYKLSGFRMRPNQYGYRTGVFGALQVVPEIADDERFIRPDVESPA